MLAPRSDQMMDADVHLSSLMEGEAEPSKSRLAGAITRRWRTWCEEQAIDVGKDVLSAMTELYKVLKSVWCYPERL